MTLLERVLGRLQQDYGADGKASLFTELKAALTGDKALRPYAEIAEHLGLSEGALKVAVHRLRQRYGELLREEIAHTVSCPEEIEEELRYLFEVLNSQ